MDLKFSAFSSEIEMPFYSALFQLKLDYDKLDDSARQVIGLYEPRSHVDPSAGTKMQIHGAALTSNHVPFGLARAEGIIKNYNKIEDFKTSDKTAMLNNAGRQIWDAIQDGTIYSVPSMLSSFIILSYADLKKYKFTYWFGFPALHSAPAWKRTGDVGRMTSKESTNLVDRIGTWRYSVDNRQHGFFLAKKIRKVRGEAPVSDDPGQSDLDDPDVDDPEMDVGYKWVIGALGDFEQGFFNGVDEENRYVGFVDPSNYEDSASWPLRNLLVLIRERFRFDKVQIICYRDVQARRHEARTIILPLAMDKVEDMGTKTVPKITGWERNQNNELKARIANLAEYMDPARLADQAVDLNLKLMKWRIAPNLNLESIRNTSCLLLGAGTLGSYVSRNLMGWGVKKITFVDYGKVSYSNPVRQPLFEFADCADGGKEKAPQAAAALKQIYPGIEAAGHAITVPMLGHPILDEAKTKADFNKLKELINSHDAIFLLMDSRESRWLPTLMGKAAGKIVLNAALGFDTYVVMRHGPTPVDGSQETLGCYFCNDVVVAADSMKEQTLDQQCTVTRPGVAAIASALLVELFASILQHPKKHHAPAPVHTASEGGSTYERDPPDHALGIVPHQIRGFLHTFQNLVIRGQSYPHCSACSKQIVAAYQAGGWAFVKKALEDRNFVAELSGLAEVQRKAEAAADDVEWSEEEEGLNDDGEPVLV